jgi:uncharacterized protein YjbI with pentapeptide repeats
MHNFILVLILAGAAQTTEASNAVGPAALCVEKKLTGVQLPKADLARADFSRSDLSQANLAGANLQPTLWNATAVPCATLRWTRCRSVVSLP